MKKILLTATMLIAGMTATFAQMPDASKWKVGDEITNQVGWTNLSFESENLTTIKETGDKDPDTGEPDVYEIDGWTFEKQEKKGNTTRTGGLFEMYDGAEGDLYQYVQLPAGMYRVECQGYYRCGNSWAEDPNLFGSEDWADNALLYVQNGAYDVESKAFTADRTFKTPLMPRLFLNQQTQLYVGIKEGEEGYPGWDMSDGNYGEKGWGPCSVPGSLVWFQEGLYAPYDDEEGTKYNTVTFFLKEDGYARIGVSKKDPKSADSFMVTNFKMYYEGEAGEVTELMAAQEEVADIYHQLETLGNEVEKVYDGGLLAAMIGDAVMEFENGEYGNIEDLTMEECALAKAEIQAIYDEAAAAVAAYAQLYEAVKVMTILYDRTNYPGKAEFGAILKEAQDCFDPDYAGGDDDSFGMFQTIEDELVAARITYLMTQEKVNGAYDFSSAINNPFFCDNEYSPVWNEEANAYQFPTIEGVDEALQPENTWAMIQEQDYKEAKAEAGHEEWIPICDNVKWSEKYVENQWVVKTTMWHGNSGLGVTMQHSYPALGGWRANCTGENPEIFSQTITGLPNGYYGMSALMCNAGAEVSPLQYVYIEAGESKETAPLTMKATAWWNGSNPTLYRSQTWEKLNTNMVYVSDGKLTIGSSSDGFYAVTGFQLYYYGEEPDFNELVAPALTKAQENAAALAWPGDRAAALAILANVPSPIANGDDYEAAQAVIKEANEYCATANNTINNWKALENFSALMDAQAEGSPEQELVQTAWMEVMSMGDEETDDTYLDAIAADEDYAAYVDYLDYRAAMGDLIKKDAVAAVVAKQNAALIEQKATAAELAEMKKELAAPYNKEFLASFDLANASEKNPVDITGLLVNPKFDEGDKGWSGAPTVTGAALAVDLGAAEKYNCNFDVYQIIYNLPAGCYMVQAQAFYRDADNATKAYDNWFYDAGEEMEFWTPNAQLYANENIQPIVSIASETFDTPSMTAFRDKMVEAEEGDEYGNTVYVEHWITRELLPDVDEAYQEVNTDGWYWDTEINDFDEISYYPASLMGTSHRFEKNPNAYINKTATMVEEGGTLRLGIKKSTLITNDWVAMDNFKLFYLGTTAPTGINEVAGNAAAPAGIYTVSGVKTNGMQKGLNIVKMANGEVKKVYVK